MKNGNEVCTIPELGRIIVDSRCILEVKSEVARPFQSVSHLINSRLFRGQQKSRDVKCAAEQA
jgi:hypothetical protein